MHSYTVANYKDESVILAGGMNTRTGELSAEVHSQDIGNGVW